MSKETAVPAWIPGARFEDALLYATRAHAHQARKGGTVPYLAHLFAVASLVMEDGGTEDETIAALLHDAAEDQGGEQRLRDIEERFGAEVAEIVRGCSEPLTIPKLPWTERKASYLRHLPGATVSVLRVSLADKLHNARSMALDHGILGDALWERFSAGRDEQATYYTDLCVAFRDRGSSSALVSELEAVVARLFAE